MRIGNLKGRAVILRDGLAYDIHESSAGEFSEAPRAVLERWNDFRKWAETAELVGGVPYSEAELDAPVPDPKQVFAIGMNYGDHADEVGIPYPTEIVVFTKFVSSLAGPRANVKIYSDKVDYEAELVAVIGTEATEVSEDDAWGVVAGLAVGQDYSERILQTAGKVPQFSLGKSYPAYGPFGPAIVTLDEIPNPDDLAISGVIEGPGYEGSFVLQESRTSNLIFSVPRIIADLSKVVTLYPGDLIFTGTPGGVGNFRGIYLKPGQTMTTEIEGLGSLVNRFV